MLDYNMKSATGQFLALAAGYGLQPDFEAFHARAKLTWKTGRFAPTVCSAIDTSPAVVDGVIYVSSADRNLYAFDLPS